MMDNELTDDERIEGELHRAGAELRGWGPGDSAGASVEPLDGRSRRPVLVPIAASLTLLAGVAGVAAIVSGGADEPVPVSVASGDVGGETEGSDGAGTNATPGERHSEATIQDAERAVFASDVVAKCSMAGTPQPRSITRDELDSIASVSNVTSWYELGAGTLVVGLDAFGDDPIDWVVAERATEELTARLPKLDASLEQPYCWVSPAAQTRVEASADSVTGEVVRISRALASGAFYSPETVVSAAPGQAVLTGTVSSHDTSERLTVHLLHFAPEPGELGSGRHSAGSYLTSFVSTLPPSEFEIIEP